MYMQYDVYMFLYKLLLFKVEHNYDYISKWMRDFMGNGWLAWPMLIPLLML